MKKLSIEEKAKAYDEALPQLKGLLDGVRKENVTSWRKILLIIFPELKESEDEIIIRALKSGFKLLESEYKLIGLGGIKFKKIVSWLDKQYHLWTIQDAKDGDVLYNAEHNYILIYKHQIGTNDFVSYCRLCLNTYTFYPCEEFKWDDLIWNPATKEQHDTLFTKMKEAGYEWDVEKLELKKIEPNPAWSEEDEEIYKKIETAIDSYYAPFSRDAEEMSDWLKSLKERVQPQNQWKPSKEQMEALEHSLGDYNITVFEERHKILTSLYNDLKKLKG